jgi:hypothetical protein
MKKPKMFMKLIDKIDVKFMLVTVSKLAIVNVM